MGVWMGVSSVVTVNSGLSGLKVHSIQMRAEAPEYDVTGRAETNTVTTYGDRKLAFRLECSHDGSTPALIFPGDATNLTFKIDSTGTAYTEDFTVSTSDWGVEKRGGGPPQRFFVSITPHSEAANNSTATGGIWPS